MKKFILLTLLLIIVAAIPLTIYIIEQQTRTRGKAESTTTLALITPKDTISVGESFSVDVQMNPGTNSVSIVKLQISFDNSKIDIQDTNIIPNTTAFPVILEGPSIGNCSGTTCTILLTTSVGSDPTKIIIQPTKVATLTFTAKQATDPKTQIAFTDQTQVLSSGGTESANENLIQSKVPLALTIVGELQPTITATSAAITTTPRPLLPTNTPVQQVQAPTNTPTPVHTTNNTASTSTPTPTFTSSFITVQTPTPTPTRKVPATITLSPTGELRALPIAAGFGVFIMIIGAALVIF